MSYAGALLAILVFALVLSCCITVYVRRTEPMNNLRRHVKGAGETP